MRLLPDTHALIWFLEDDARLGRQARAAICDGANESLVSDATAWEAGIKHSVVGYFEKWHGRPAHERARRPCHAAQCGSGGRRADSK